MPLARPVAVGRQPPAAQAQGRFPTRRSRRAGDVHAVAPTEATLPGVLDCPGSAGTIDDKDRVEQKRADAPGPRGINSPV
jgi:hypothetical protein